MIYAADQYQNVISQTGSVINVHRFITIGMWT